MIKQIRFLYKDYIEGNYEGSGEYKFKSDEEYINRQCHFFSDSILAEINPKFRNMFIKLCDSHNIHFVRNSTVGGFNSVVYLEDENEFFTTIALNSNIKDINSLANSFYHEVGHTIDTRLDYDRNNCYHHSFVTNINDSDTLDSILRNELETNKYDIYDDLVHKFSLSIDREFGKGAFDRYNRLIGLKREQKKQEIKKESALEQLMHEYFNTYEIFENDPSVFDGLDDSSINFINEINSSKSMIQFRNNYEALFDALSAVMKFKNFSRSNIHSKHYYSINRDFLATEFFANMFSLFMRKDNNGLKIIKNYLPLSYDNFFTLLDMISKKYYKEDLGALDMIR